MSGFFVSDGDRLVEVSENPFDSEDALQSLIERFPVLVGTTGDRQHRYVLVRREQGVPDRLEGAGRWSIDHLFLDETGTPTLVEVKRSSDTRIRREVVGQMLDYAANAVAYWPVADIRAELQLRLGGDGAAADAAVGELCGFDVEEFWGRVQANLDAARLRLLFVADEIPSELQRVIEFLNQQMKSAEVLGLAVKRYASEGVESFIVNVVGDTAVARQTKTSSGPRPSWDEISFFEQLRQRVVDQSVIGSIRQLYGWSRQVGEVVWGSGRVTATFNTYVSIAGLRVQFLHVEAHGSVHITPKDIVMKLARDEGERSRILAAFRSLGAVLDDERIPDWRVLPASTVAGESTSRAIQTCLEEIIEKYPDARGAV